MEKQAAVVGLGDFLSGDYGAGGYVVEALEQEFASSRITCSYVGFDAWKTGLHTLDKKLICIVHAISSAYPPGAVRILDIASYQHVCLQAGCSTFGNAVVNSLAPTAMLSSAPAAYRFVLIEAGNAYGLDLSHPVRRAVRTAVRRISRMFAAEGYHTLAHHKISRMYRLELPSITL